MKKGIMLLALVAFIAASCGKYEEGPKISFASKNARLVNSWKIEKKYYNNVEQTILADESADIMELQDGGACVMTDYTGSASLTYSGTWSLSDSKEVVTVTFSVGILSTSTDYKILRLKEDELWVEHTSGNTVIESHFVTK